MTLCIEFWRSKRIWTRICEILTSKYPHKFCRKKNRFNMVRMILWGISWVAYRSRSAIFLQNPHLSHGLTKISQVILLKLELSLKGRRTIIKTIFKRYRKELNLHLSWIVNLRRKESNFRKPNRNWIS